MAGAGAKRSSARTPAAGLLLLVLAAATVDLAAAEGAEARAREVMLRLDERLGTIRSLRGRFTQTFTSSGLGIPQSEEGTFALLRPDRLRWEYSRPERKTAVSDGRSTWLYLPEQDLVYRGSVGEWKESGAFAVLAGGTLDSQFEAVEVTAEGVSRPGHVLLKLAPRTPREEYERLLIEIDPGRMLPFRITAVDGMGNQIGMTLDDVEENPRLPERHFEFTPPEGVEVVDQSSRPEPRPSP